MSKTFELEIESIIARLQPIRLEVLQAEQHFREELVHVFLGNLQSARDEVLKGMLVRLIRANSKFDSKGADSI